MTWKLWSERLPPKATYVVALRKDGTVRKVRWVQGPYATEGCWMSFADMPRKEKLEHLVYWIELPDGTAK